MKTSIKFIAFGVACFLVGYLWHASHVDREELKYVSELLTSNANLEGGEATYQIRWQTCDTALTKALNYTETLRELGVVKKERGKLEHDLFKLKGNDATKRKLQDGGS